MQLLAIDIENSETSIGLFSGNDLVAVWHVGSQGRTGDEYFLLMSDLLSSATKMPVDAVAIASVVPSALSQMRVATERLVDAPPLVIGPGVKTGLEMQVDHPREVGADRVVNAVAAKELFGHPVIVVDFGTATTIDVVGPNGAFLGGSIAPGLEVSLDGMVASTSALRRVDLIAPKSVVGKTTVEAMQSGLVLGYAAMVDGLITRIMDELDLGLAAKVATGHLAHVIVDLSAQVDIVEEGLTLRGLKLAFDRNRSQ